MRISRVLLVVALASGVSGFGATYAGAQSNGRPYTAGEGDAAEITACNADAAKFCNDEIMWQTDMEECLLKHMSQVSKACQAQLKPFSFKKYYNSEPHLF
jgi:hypothetical protein